MDVKNYDNDGVTSSLKLWREKILANKRKDLTTGDLTSLFQQEVDLQKAFFKLIDRDSNGALTIEEWTGCFSKILGDNDSHSLLWFVEKFHEYSNSDELCYLNEKDFNTIVADAEFGFRFASIISPKSRRINCLKLITSLEIIGSLSTDSKWLSWLKYQFTAAIKKKQTHKKINDEISSTHNESLCVTLEDFRENFFFKEPFLANRLFDFLDKDKSGTLNLHEFINGLEVVVNGNTEEKIQFLFQVFDTDGDGVISFDEMRMMLKCCLQDSPSLDMNETVEDLTAILFKENDRDQSGNISLLELKHAFVKHDAIFKTLTVSTSIWIKPKFISKSSNKGFFNKIKNIIINKRASIIFWTCYMLINLACMTSAYLNYATASQFVICARIFGNALNFNCSLILVLVLRKHFTWLRIKGASSFLPLDDSIDIHKKVGIIIFIMGIIHTIAHLINLYYVCNNPDPEKVLIYWVILFTDELNLGYPTGVILTGLFIIILLFAMPFVRKRGYFQLFYWFHMCTIPWLIIMLLHGKKFWIWILIPFFCYLIEKLLKYRKTSSNKFGDTIIMETFVLPSKVVHLVIRKPPKFYFKPGDYVFINIPAIAKYEWHPFSISSAPENSKFIWLHIRACGNWTNKLYSYSLSSKFDMSLTCANGGGGSPSSNMRASMRQRMSKSLNDSNLFPILSNDKKHLALLALNEQKNENETKQNDKSSEKNYFKENIKKIVSFSESQILDSLNTNVVNTNLVTNNFHENVNTKEKIINKTTIKEIFDKQEQRQTIGKLYRSLSFDNGNDSSKDNDNKDEKDGDPSESTPKFILNQQDNHSTDQSFLSANGDHPKVKEEKVKTKFRRSQSLNCRSKNKTYSNDKLVDENEDKINSDNSKERRVKFQKVKSVDQHNNSLNLSSRLKMSLDLEKMKQFLKSKNFISPKEKNLNKIILNNKNDQELQQTLIELEDDNMVSCENKPNKAEESNLKVIYKNGTNPVAKFKNNNTNVINLEDDNDELGYLKMYKRTNCIDMNTIGTDRLWRLKVFIDGPYGTPSMEIFNSEHAVLVAAGIGITPFASILQSLMFRYRQARALCPNCNTKLSDKFINQQDKLSVKRVDFIWITREQRSLEWFISILSQMEIEQRKNNESFLETHLYVTSAKRKSDLKTISLQYTIDCLFSEEESSLIDGLRKRTNYGRPNWDIVMQNLIRKQQGKITVFYCGPPALANTLQVKSKQYNFNFKKEIF